SPRTPLPRGPLRGVPQVCPRGQDLGSLLRPCACGRWRLRREAPQEELVCLVRLRLSWPPLRPSGAHCGALRLPPPGGHGVRLHGPG
ncbi:hypothetical protein K4K54_001657, partial [Colletotrichum sp. SAR 10_86]